MKERGGKVSQLKAGAALSYFTMGLNYLVSLAFMPVMIRLSGQSEYGLYNLAASVISYLAILNLGFESSYMRFYIRAKVGGDEARVARLNGLFLKIFAVIGFVTFLAGLLMFFNARVVLGGKLTQPELEKAKILMLLLTFNLSFSLLTSVFSSHIVANERFIFHKVVQLLKIILNPLIMLPLLLAGFGSVGIVLTTVILNVAVDTSHIAYCFKKLKIRFSFKRFDSLEFREIVVFSSFVLLNILTDQLNWNSDKFILGHLGGTVPVAVYGLSLQLVTYFINLSIMVAGVFMPRVHTMVAQGSRQVSNLFVKVGRLQFMLMSLVFTGLVFFGRPFIRFWAGGNYDLSYPILLLLLVSVTVPSIQTIGIEIQRANNMHKFRSVAYLVAAVVNFGLTFVLARKLGGLGAAISSAVTMSFTNGLLMNWYYYKRIGLDIPLFWRQMGAFLPALAIPAALGVMMMVFLPMQRAWVFAVSVAAYTLVFCLSMWRFGMNEWEKSLVNRPLRRLLRKSR